MTAQCLPRVESIQVGINRTVHLSAHCKLLTIPVSVSMTLRRVQTNLTRVEPERYTAGHDVTMTHDEVETCELTMV